MSWFLQGQRKTLFLKKTRYFGVFYSTVKCELCVYRQEETEFEMITQISFRTQLGASLN